MDTLSSTVSKIGESISPVSNAVFLQVQTSIDNAIATSKTVYQSLGLLNKPTPLDVRHEFASLTATIDQTIPALNVFPADAAQGDHVLDIAPKGVAVCAALSRTTAALKGLPGPVSHEDGIALLNSYEEVQTKTVTLFSLANTRFASFEHGAPGLVNHGLNRVKELYQDLTEALSGVLPPSISQDKVQGLHTSIQGTFESSFAQLRSVSSN